MEGDSTQFPVYLPFASEWISFGVFLAGILIAIGIAEFAQKRYQWPGETTRKIVHVLVGVLIFWARFLFETPLPPIVLATIFTILNALALKTSMFQGMHGTTRLTLGTTFYPLSFLILVVIFWYRDPVILLLSFTILAIGDPLAAQVGETVAHPRRFTLWKDTKSLQGSLTLGVASFVITTAGLYGFGRLPAIVPPPVHFIFLTGVAVALVSMVAEAISRAGSDNLTLPLSAAFTMDITLHGTGVSPVMFFVWLLIAFLFAYIAYQAHVLTLNGTAAAFLLGTFIFGIGGLQFMVPLATFFVLSSALSRLGGQQKNLLKTVYEKTGNRDMMQVMANGGVAGIMALLWHFTHQDALYYGFLGSLAAATADTWATELGIFARQRPRNIVTFRPVEAGTSGGITPFGTTGALLGSGILSLSGWVIPTDLIQPFFRSRILLIIILSGLIGAMVDSLLGATIQGQYRCPVCRKSTEKKIHCSGSETRLIRGYRWLNNDVVNFICTATGGVLVLVLLG
ncbi:MAG TPA: DUF92 domain-containing protein [bacterium]|nr:DUF92 domain-containing protein [bacterium]